MELFFVLYRCECVCVNTSCTFLGLSDAHTIILLSVCVPVALMSGKQQSSTLNISGNIHLHPDDNDAENDNIVHICSTASSIKQLSSYVNVYSSIRIVVYTRR